MSIRRATLEAVKSCFRQHKVGAVVAKGSRILSTGYNSRQHSSLLQTSTRHAEAAAILKILKERRQHDLVGADLFVTRITGGGRVGMAKPCRACEGLARSVGIRKVFYTTNENTTEEWKL